ncbi:MAG: hypothetical protein ACE5EH_13150 [Gammaproteobacteria bacterium]
MKNKFVKGALLGSIPAFFLGINFGKDAPLLSNPFSNKPDFADRVIERAHTVIDDTKQAIHTATKKTDAEYNQ